MNSGYRWEMEWVDQTLYTFDCLLWGKHVCRLLIRKLVKKKKFKSRNKNTVELYHKNSVIWILPNFIIVWLWVKVFTFIITDFGKQIL